MIFTKGVLVFYLANTMLSIAGGALCCGMDGILAKLVGILLFLSAGCSTLIVGICIGMGGSEKKEIKAKDLYPEKKEVSP